MEKFPVAESFQPLTEIFRDSGRADKKCGRRKPDRMPPVDAGKEFVVQHYDVNELLAPGRFPTILVVGARGSGKSVLLRDLLFRFHNAGVPRVCVFSPTEQVNSFFSTFIPATFIHSPISIEALDAVWKGQHELAMRKAVGQLSADADIRLILVLDDCAHDKKFLASKSLREMFLNGRHSGIIVIVTLQYLLDLCVALRSNAEVIFVQREDSAKNRERLYTQIASFMPSQSAFNQVLDQTTLSYESLVIKPVVRVANPTAEDKVAFYRGDATLDFRFGSPEMWRFHDRRYLSDAERFLTQQREREAVRAAMSTAAAEREDSRKAGGGAARRPSSSSSTALIVRKVM